MIAEGLRPKLVLVGAKGMLASAVLPLARGRFEVTPLDLPDFDVTDRGQVLARVAAHAPEVILNCAAFTDVDGAESECELAGRVNGEGPGFLAEAARRTGAILVHISSDYVFGGSKRAPYAEHDPTGPRSAYGRSKLRGEEAILGSGLARFLLVRTSWLYGPNGRNFVETILRLASEREELRVVSDQVGSPTNTGDLAQAILTLLELECEGRAPAGVYHFSGEGACSWFEFACAIVAEARGRGAELRVRDVHAVATQEYPAAAERPAYSVLAKDKYRRVTGCPVPHWQDALTRYFDGRGAGVAGARRGA
ncbi:MAG: dTDP-4-dehydrorhamnose reductase [Proteobacteria bacterium]|nr:dTDP-4-dehydrorhamnose reductase [Pseudomonadota bacterium]